jgi:ssDNA-binding Zn-finger/Zn-ribbon topoisomerase 1
MVERGEMTCAKCARSLPKNEFSLNYSGKRSSVCRECIRRLVPKKAYDEKLEVPAKPTGNPPCPKCQTRTNKLNFDGYGTLYECTNIECLDKFRVAAGRVLVEGATPPQVKSRLSTDSEVPPTPSIRTSDVEAGSPEPERELEKKEKPMANEWKCEICSAVFTVPQALGAHKRFVHAGKQKADPKPEPEAAVTTPKAKRVKAAQAEKFKDVIDRLRAKRQAAIDDFVAESEEVAAIDKAIEALEFLGK